MQLYLIEVGKDQNGAAKQRDNRGGSSESLGHFEKVSYIATVPEGLFPTDMS